MYKQYKKCTNKVTKIQTQCDNKYAENETINV